VVVLRQVAGERRDDSPAEQAPALSVRYTPAHRGLGARAAHGVWTSAQTC